MKKVTVNKKFVVQVADVLKGLVVAVLTSVLTAAQNIAVLGEFNWTMIAMAAVSGGSAYILNRFFSKPQVVTYYDSNAKAKEVAEDIKNN